MKNKAFTLIEGIVVAILIFAVATLISVIAVGCSACRKIKGEGIKPALKEVWEGPKTI